MTGHFLIGERGLAAVLCAALVAAVAFAFWPALGGDWLNWDDHQNFTENPEYRGLSAENIAWAWTTYRVGVYQPLAWILLGAQYLVSGMDPWGYHLASIAMHAAVAVVLFLVCLEAGGRVRPTEGEAPRRLRMLGTALAVALVMVHPLRVEVVAWISCQPYLPCALFYLLALWAYLRAHPAEGRFRAGWLAASMAMFVAALLSKAPAVSLPAVLLIFDIWLLGRLPGAPWTWWRRERLVVLAEKLAFAAVTVPFAAAAVAAKLGLAVPDAIDQSLLKPVPFLQLAESLWFYPLKTLVPIHLSPFYGVVDPSPGTWKLRAIAPWATVVAVVLMVLRPRAPATGIALAYIVALAPNLGLVRISTQVAADRYVFIPSLIILVMACMVRWQDQWPAWPLRAAGWPGAALRDAKWPVAALRAAGWPRAALRAGALAAALLAVPVLAGLSRAYAPVWRDSITLWEHALRLRGGSAPTVLSGLGQAYMLAGRHGDAVRMYAAGVTLQPRLGETHRNLGLALAHAGKLEEAETHLRIAASISPQLPQIMFILGQVLWRQDKTVPALAAFSMALFQEPSNREARDIVVDILTNTQDLDPPLLAIAREALSRR